MIYKIILALIPLVTMSVFAGTSKRELIEGTISKIQQDTVVVLSHGKDITVKKKYIPRDKLQVGTSISVIIDSEFKK